MIAFLFIFIQTSSALNETPANKSLANYNSGELLTNIFNINDTESRAGYGLANFENKQNGYIENGESNYLINANFYDENSHQQTNHNTLNYQNAINNDVTKKRRKRRKPKESHNGFKYSGYQHYGDVPQNNYPYLVDQHYDPSLASSALSYLTGAVSSIAKYDDRQCVARMLCEAATGALSSSIFERISWLQPLFTLLTAYSSLSSTPLLVFGRAVLLGASSPGTASCRYAHPLCPTDTEELVHYLNNHNGGFFRFFNAPEQGQANLEQFYNQLSQNNFNQPNQYGLYHQDVQQNNRPILYPDTGYHQYGFAFPYNNRFGNNDIYGNKIQKRIQNKPFVEYPGINEQISKFVFPETNDNNANKYYISNDYISNNNELKFPVDTNLAQNNFRRVRGFSFPGSNVDNYYNTNPSNDRFLYSNYNNYLNHNNKRPTYNRFVYNNNDNLLNRDRDISNIQTVYVVRGNGDPNRPEIVHLRPGETVQK